MMRYSARSTLFGLFSDPVFHRCHELMQWHSQRIGDFPQPDRRWVQNPAFEATDVGAVKAAFCAELFLGKSGTFSKIADNKPNGLSFEVCGLNLASAPLHRQTHS